MEHHHQIFRFTPTFFKPKEGQIVLVGEGNSCLVKVAKYRNGIYKDLQTGEHLVAEWYGLLPKHPKLCVGGI